MEMTLAATEGDPGRYEVGSMKLLDRRAALKTMVLSGWPPRCCQGYRRALSPKIARGLMHP